METRDKRFPEALRLAVGEVVLNASALDVVLCQFGNAARRFYGEKETRVLEIMARGDVPKHAKGGVQLLAERGHSKSGEVDALIKKALRIRSQRNGPAHAVKTLSLDVGDRFTYSHITDKQVRVYHVPISDAAAELRAVAAQIREIELQVMHTANCLRLRSKGWHE